MKKTIAIQRSALDQNEVTAFSGLGKLKFSDILLKSETSQLKGGDIVIDDKAIY